MADRLLQSLLRAGAKASKIARLCRAEASLFSLIVQEKGVLWNKKVDFKTLADVFIQQVVKAEISSEFCDLLERIRGEENNEFTNALGEKVLVEIAGEEDETAKMLSVAFSGNHDVARRLSSCAHSRVDCPDVDPVHLSELASCHFATDRVGVWVDPIDCTSQFVAGIEDSAAERGVHPHGLQCVTVLIGAYDVTTGTPIMGVIYQPFHCKVGGEWRSKCYWGACIDGKKMNNIEQILKENLSSIADHQPPLVVVSSNDDISTVALQGQVDTCVGSGAGYKCLCVITGAVDAYVYYHDACHAWDTCAPQAILMSIGGGIARLKPLLQGDDTTRCQVRYNATNASPSPPWANIGGVLAYSGTPRSQLAVKLLQKIKFV